MTGLCPIPSRQSTLIPLLAVRAVTFPVVSRIIEVSVLRHPHSDAGPAGHSIPAIAFPSKPVRRVHQVSIRWHLDGDTGLLDCSIPALAFPSIAVGVQMSVRRHLDDDAGVIDLPITSIAGPTAPVGDI